MLSSWISRYWQGWTTSLYRETGKSRSRQANVYHHNGEIPQVPCSGVWEGRQWEVSCMFICRQKTYRFKHYYIGRPRIGNLYSYVVRSINLAFLHHLTSSSNNFIVQNLMTFGKAAHELVMHMQKIDSNNYPEVVFYDRKINNPIFVSFIISQIYLFFTDIASDVHRECWAGF